MCPNPTRFADGAGASEWCEYWNTSSVGPSTPTPGRRRWTPSIRAPGTFDPRSIDTPDRWRSGSTRTQPNTPS
jgi:hypothetical protein